MHVLDWHSLILPDETTLEGVSNHQKVVTRPVVVTHQAPDSKDKNSTCNHVTTETTKTEEIRPRHFEDEVGHLPGGEWCATDRAGSDTRGSPVYRPVLHYRLHDVRNGAGSLIGEPGDALSSLLHVLVLHYGDRLDVESVREAFEERAAIIEFDARLPRTDAEHSAAAASSG